MQEQQDAMNRRAESKTQLADEQDNASNSHEQAEQPKHTVGETLAGLHLVLIGHVNPLSHEQVGEEQHHPLLVVGGPLREEVLHDMTDALGRCNSAEQRNHNEDDAAHTMHHAEDEHDVGAHHLSQRRNEHEASAQAQKDAGGNCDAMRPTSLQRVALDVALGASGFAIFEELLVSGKLLRRNVHCFVTHRCLPSRCRMDDSRECVP